MKRSNYIVYREVNLPCYLVKTAVSGGKDDNKSSGNKGGSSDSGSSSSNSSSSSGAKLYSQSEYDNLIKQYEESRRGDIPYGSPESIFDSRKQERQGTLDDINNTVRRNKYRANGLRTWLVGAGGFGGYHLGRQLGKLFELDKGPQLGLDASNNPVYGNPGWKKFLANMALRYGGALVGGAVPYFLTRGLEGAWSAGSSGIKALTGGR